MKGDFSRQTFDPKKRYSGVLMQQGRVQLDADWNEQGDIQRYHFETEGTDIIGECGAPIDNAGFQVTTDGKAIFIGAGRFYADGILVENDIDALSYDDQDKGDMPGASLKDALEAMAKQDRTLAIAYLDVWRRHITALDDAHLREVALGGPDTTTRLKTVWQVRLLPVSTRGPDSGEVSRLERQGKEVEAKLADVDKQLAAVDENLAKQRAELSTTTAARSRVRIERLIQQLTAERETAGKGREELVAQLREVRAKLKELRAVRRPDCSTTFPEWDGLFAPHGKLNARAKPTDPSDDPCELPAGSSYTRLENQLYRVEVHKPGALGTATFKWSRDNGTVVTAVEKVTGSSVFVHDLGPDDVLGFANGQWVELSDDARELNGLPGQLAQIVDIKPATNEIILDVAPGALGRHPKLRRWDQKNVAGAPANANGVLTSGSWLPLEDGVEVQFSGGPFATGDYWLIPARTATGDVEWPPYEVPNVNPIAQERRGVVHHYCRLALVELRGEKLQLLGDCRKLFPPLTAIQSTTAPPAMHVVATSWENDAGMAIQEFLEEGLRVRLDAPPDPASIDNDSILVTVDFPYLEQGDDLPNSRERVILLGQTGVDPNDARTIVWRWIPPANVTGRSVNRLITRPVAAATIEYRVNVTLRGRVIWQQTGRDLIHLDGQAFAQPDIDPVTKNVRADLVLPSGASVRASDFESWFFLRNERPKVDSLRVAKLDLLRVISGQPTQVVRSVSEFPQDPDKPLQLTPNDAFNRLRVTFTRSVQPEGEFGNDRTPARLELTPLRGNVTTVVAQVTVKGDLLEFRPNVPEIISVLGIYRFTIVSSNENDVGIRAAADGTALDGDFNGESGASFRFVFTMGG
jgi:hypothetical protein